MNEYDYRVSLPPPRRRSYRRVPLSGKNLAHSHVLSHPRLGMVTFGWSTYTDAPGVTSQIGVVWRAQTAQMEVDIAAVLVRDNRHMQLHNTEYMAPSAAREWWEWFTGNGFTVHSTAKVQR